MTEPEVCAMGGCKVGWREGGRRRRRKEEFVLWVGVKWGGDREGGGEDGRVISVCYGCKVGWRGGRRRRGGREEGEGGDDDSARKRWEHHSHIKSHTNRVFHVYVRQQIQDFKGA